MVDPVDPALRRLSDALGVAGVRWAVLRGEVGAPDDGDLDLLVHPDDVAAFASVARASGFPHLPAWGHAHHRFHLGRGRGGWWRLDVVDRFRFGGGVRLDPAVVAVVLDRRVGIPLPRLAPDDAAWALVLHLLLDRRTRSDRDRARLTAVADAAASGPLAASLTAVLPDGWTPDRLRSALAGDDPGIDDVARRVRDRLRSAYGPSRLAATSERLRDRLARWARKPLTAIHRSGPSVALLGPDGAGKSALISGLLAAFPLPVRTAYLGLYPAGTERSSGPKGLGFLRRLGSLWRRAIGARFQRWRGRLVVFDRHPLDARLPARGRRRTLDRIRRWILGHALPVPDLVLVLDAPGEVLHARKAEFPADVLETERGRYRVLASSLSRAELVDASRPAAEVLDDVVDRIWAVWADRLDHGADTGPRR